MVKYGKFSPIPGGASIKYGSSTTVRMNATPPVTKILNIVQEPNILQKILFKLFGVKSCSHYLTIEYNDAFKIKRILDEHNIQYSLFGIDRTNYYCFDDVSMTHMRLIQ